MTREWAIEILKHDIYLDKRGMTYSHDAVGIEAHVMAIKALELAPKIGHWISDVFVDECSVCGEQSMFFEDQPKKFCPNCGARMVESQESEEE